MGKMDLPGLGDSATWGAVWHPNDPRRDDGAEDRMAADLWHTSETVRYHLEQVEKLIDKGDFAAAQVEFDKIAEVTL